jgi:hypothetical protein
MKAKLTKITDIYTLIREDGKMIASDDMVLQKNYQIDKLSREKCDEIFGIIDVEKLAEESVPDGFRTIWKDGFNRAIELNRDKLFTLEDMRKAFKVGFSQGFASDIISMHNLPEEKEKLFDEFIRPIQPSIEIEVEIETKKVIDSTEIIGAVKGVKGSGHKINTYKQVPKLDADGCVILKKIEGSEKREKYLTDLMKGDEDLGLYETP